LRIKRPDVKNAVDMVAAAKADIEYTLTLVVTDASATTIVRNVYESYRLLGDALLVAKGISSIDHVSVIEELLKLQVELPRPIQVIDNLRRLRRNINYYGYRATALDAADIVDFTKKCSELLIAAVVIKIS
jgi:hypothetical protein